MTSASSAEGVVGTLSEASFASRLQTGLALRVGPFNARIVANASGIEEPLYGLYRDYRLLPDPSVFSFHAQIQERRTAPFFGRRLVRFSVDGRTPHEDMPAEQALPVLEWGLNLVIALRSHQYLMLHSAAVALNDSGLLLPATPGSGKTTLSAGLALRGWRLLSDEFGLLRPGTTDLVPIPRPLALKNESIEVIREFDADAHIGPSIPNTRKGTVAHLRPPGSSILEAERTAAVKWIVFPQWEAKSECVISEISKSEAFMLLATNAFNYELLGDAGFDTVARLVENAACFDLVYSDLDTAVGALSDVLSQ
ncbi:MAG: HprK-related kinase A [Pseudomonadota bacterium]